MMPDVHIDIDEIVLDEAVASDPGAFRAALVDTLTALASAHRGDYPEGAAAVLNGPRVTSAATGHFGADVAHSVWSSIVPPAGGQATRGGAGHV